MKKVFDNREFWDARYREAPRLGSGPGSRGYSAWLKKQVVKQTVRDYGCRSIVDVGCGDLCWLDDEIASSTQYLGLDVSAVIIERNRLQHPACSFRVQDVTTNPIQEQADLVVSFDVLLHQCDRDDFLALVRNLLGATRRLALISYRIQKSEYHIDSDAPADVIADEEALRQYVKSLGKFAKPKGEIWGDFGDIARSIDQRIKVELVGRYAHHGIYRVERTSGGSEDDRHLTQGDYLGLSRDEEAR